MGELTGNQKGGMLLCRNRDTLPATQAPAGQATRDPRKLGNTAGEVRGSHQSVPALDQQSRAVPVMDVTWEHRATPRMNSSRTRLSSGLSAPPTPPEQELHNSREFVVHC